MHPINDRGCRNAIKGVGQTLTLYIVMKKFFYVAVLALAMTSCGNKAAAPAEEAATCDSIVATDIVPAAATEVLPAAAPSEENGGKVATEVIPAEPAK